jgi:hypothetical protein
MTLSAATADFLIIALPNFYANICAKSFESDEPRNISLKTVRQTFIDQAGMPIASLFL